jgi:hypothetical protein
MCFYRPSFDIDIFCGTFLEAPAPNVKTNKSVFGFVDRYFLIISEGSPSPDSPSDKNIIAVLHASVVPVSVSTFIPLLIASLNCVPPPALILLIHLVISTLFSIDAGISLLFYEIACELNTTTPI